MSTEHIVYLGLGSNLGRREEAIQKAIEQIKLSIGIVDRCSSLYETKPWGFSSDHLFMNACIRCRTFLSPEEVLEATQKIEKVMGRTEKSHNGVYEDRVIDIDILLYDNLHIHTPALTIPHPYMHERDFVMKPLLEILDESDIT